MGSCARPGAPPGGPEDRRPPVVVATEPDTFARLEEFRGPVRFQFDERISERSTEGALDDAVIVSPRGGEVRVGHARRSLTVEVVGGFQPGVVYRVTLLPVVSDLFNNRLRDPFELVFTTGPELVPSAVAGLIWERTTGRGADNLAVHAIADADSTLHVARTDTGGIYAFRYLPPGRYRMVAFEDRNRNGEVDTMEVQGSGALLLNGPDTLVLSLPVLQPDTSPARLVGAQVLDSVTLVLEFDDFLDPARPLGQMSVGLAHADEEAEGPVPSVERLWHEHEYTAWVNEVRDSLFRLDSIALTEQARAPAAPAAADTAVADSLPPDTAVADPVPAGPPAGPGTTARRGPTGLEELEAGASAASRPMSPRPAGPREALDPDGRPLPSRRVVATLDRFLETNVGFALTAVGVVNLNAVPLGGGEAAVVRAPPPDTTQAADSAAVGDTIRPDTAAVPPDTGSVVLPLLVRPPREES